MKEKKEKMKRKLQIRFVKYNSVLWEHWDCDHVITTVLRHLKYGSQCWSPIQCLTKVLCSIYSLSKGLRYRNKKYDMQNKKYDMLFNHMIYMYIIKLAEL